MWLELNYHYCQNLTRKRDGPLQYYTGSDEPVKDALVNRRGRRAVEASIPDLPSPPSLNSPFTIC